MPQSVYSRLGVTSIAPPSQTSVRHTVTGGEELTSIAQAEYPSLGYRASTWRNIATTNSITDLDAVVVGQVIRIPPPPVSAT